MNENISNVQLTHPFKDILPDVDEFLLADNGVGVINTINALCNRIKKLADKYTDILDPDKFKGDALELFAEYLCKTNASDNRIGIYDYAPIPAMDDYGVDGKGIGENQFPATVQVKFRAGDYVLTANEDKLTNFTSLSWGNLKVRVDDNKNMLLITTGLKVDSGTMENMFLNKVRVLNREALREMLDNRPEWWIRFYDAIQLSRTKKNENPSPPLVLRQHQTEAMTAIINMTATKGRIILPTGTGKTLIEAEAIRNTILEVQGKGELPVIKVNSPRILLCFQLFKDIFTRLNSMGISVSYINYNSGKSDTDFFGKEIRRFGGIYQQLVSTTSVQEVQNAYAKAVKSKLPFIIISTYHSSEKFADSGIIPHLTIHDEAHNLVSNEFCNVAILPSMKDLFFTATEKTTESPLGEGMNNVARFGEIIYSKSPKEMINAGEMVTPKIHVITAKNKLQLNLNNLDTDYDAIFRSIASAFIFHQNKIRESSFDPSNLGAKVLIVCRGQEDLQEMFKSRVFDSFRQKYPNIHVLALSSDFGIYNDNEGKCEPPVTNGKKFSLLKKIQALTPSDQAIIFHVDMIGEGIDVPGITGVMPFRNCEMTKFIQNIGRASRLHTFDRPKVYSGEIVTADLTRWIKPYSWVIIPTFLESSDGFEDRFRRYVTELRENYGFIPSQQIVIDNVRGFDDDELIATVNDKVKNRPSTNAGNIEFNHEFEKLSIVEKVIQDDELQKECEIVHKELEAIIGKF